MLLKPALEAVMKVAREGEAAEPTEPAPAQLRRYLRFARLPRRRSTSRVVSSRKTTLFASASLPISLKMRWARQGGCG